MRAETSARLPRLEILDATMNGIGPAGVAALARATLGGSGAPALRELRLAGNVVGRGGRASVGSRVRGTFTIRTLSLLSNACCTLLSVPRVMETWARRRWRGRCRDPAGGSRVARSTSPPTTSANAAPRFASGGEIVGFSVVASADAGNAHQVGQPSWRAATPRRRYRRWRTTSRPLAVSVDWTCGYNSLGDAGALAVAAAVARAAATATRDEDEDDEAAALLPPNEAAALLPPNAAAALLPPNAAAASNWTYSETRSETPARWRWRRR